MGSLDGWIDMLSPILLPFPFSTSSPHPSQRFPFPLRPVPCNHTQLSAHPSCPAHVCWLCLARLQHGCQMGMAELCCAPAVGTGLWTQLSKSAQRNPAAWTSMGKGHFSQDHILSFHLSIWLFLVCFHVQS